MNFPSIQGARALKLKQLATMGWIYLILFVVVLYPVFRMFLGSFRADPSGQSGAWVLSNFSGALASVGFVSALKNTLILAMEVVVLSTALGVLLAWIIARTDMPLKKYLEPINMVPFYLSSLVGALSWEVLAAPRSGLLNQLAQKVFGLDSPPFNIYSLTGMGLVLGIFFTPYVYLFTVGSFQNMDPSLEDAGRVSGASTASTMWRITLPLSTPAILSASLLVFIVCGSTFGVPLLLGTPARVRTLATLIWSMLDFYPPRYNVASALSCVLLVTTMLLVIVHFKVLGRRHFWTVTGKGYRPRLISLGRWRWLALGINLVYLTAVLVPFLVLLYISFIPGYAGGLNFSNLSLDNYKTVLLVDDITRRGLKNSTIISVIGATVGVIVASVLAAIIQRTRLPGRRGIDFIGMAPVAFPGIVLGVGFLIAWIKTPLYGTLWILMLAYVVHFLPTGLRSMSATLGGISPDLDECARTSGATWFGALRRILMPLMWPGLMSTWLLLFVTFMREVSSSMMLYVEGTETVAISLIQIMEYESQGVCAAFGVSFTLIILVGVYLFRKLTSFMGVKVETETAE